MTNQNNLGHFITLLQELQKIGPEFPLQYALCLAEVARDEGLSVSTLATRTNLSLSTTSRIIGALSDHRQKGTPYDLVKVRICKTERRKKELTLSARGHAIIKGIDRSIEEIKVS